MSSKNVYWPRELDEIIAQYNSLEDDIDRSILFNTHLYPAISKMVECVFNMGKYTWIHSSNSNPMYDEASIWGNIPYDDIKQAILDDAVGHVALQLRKYSPDKGKSFSYFTVITKHYFQFLSERARRDYIGNLHLSTWESANDDADQHDGEIIPLPLELQVYQPDTYAEVIPLHVKLEAMSSTVKPRSHNRLATEICTVFKDISTGDLEVSLNKKAILQVIRNRTKANTAIIRSVLTKIKPRHENI